MGTTGSRGAGMLTSVGRNLRVRISAFLAGMLMVGHRVMPMTILERAMGGGHRHTRVGYSRDRCRGCFGGSGKTRKRLASGRQTYTCPKAARRGGNANAYFGLFVGEPVGLYPWMGKLSER